MKILMIAPEPFLEPRGTSLSVFQRLQGLSALGHSIDLVTYPLGSEVSFPGVQITRTLALPFITKVQIGPSWQKGVLDVFLLFLTVRKLLQSRYDVIHSHEEASYFAAVLAKVFRTRHLYDMHSSLPIQIQQSKYGKFPLITKLFTRLEAWVLDTCDAVIAIGNDLEDRTRNRNPLAHRVMIDNLPLDGGEDLLIQDIHTEIKSKLDLNGGPVIVYTGTLEHYQGIDLLVKGIKVVKQNYPDVRLILVGGKPEQIRFYQSLTVNNYLEKNVIFTGVVPPEYAVAYLSIADVLVSPRVEGMSIPLKIYTYLHSGKPIVATRINAHSQILGEDTALLVDPSEEAIGAGILEILGDPDLGARLGAQAQRFAQEKFSFEAYTAKLNQVYLALDLPTAPSQIPAAE